MWWFRGLTNFAACLPLISCGQNRNAGTASQYLSPANQSQTQIPAAQPVINACSQDRARSALSIPKMISILQGVGSQKGEFETTEQFQSRVGAVAGTALERNHLSADDVSVTVNIPDFAIKYDADSQALQLGFKYTGLLSTSIIHNNSGKLTYYINAFEGYSSKPVGSYVGSNAFGLKKEIVKMNAVSVGLIVPGLGLSGWPGGYQDQTVTLTGIAPDIARVTKDNLAVMFVGALQAPYVETGVNHDTPTTQKPLETTTVQQAVKMVPRCAAVVNRKTGEILRNL